MTTLTEADVEQAEQRDALLSRLVSGDVKVNGHPAARLLRCARNDEREERTGQADGVCR